MQIAKKGELPFPAINVNDSVTKSKFDNLYGCKESLVDAIRRATDVMLAGKVACVAGFGDVGKGSAAVAAQRRRARDGHRRSIRSARCRRRWRAIEVVTMEEAVKRADIFVTATGNADVITAEHMTAMKNDGDRLQHRPFRQRDPDRGADQLQVDRGQAAAPIWSSSPTASRSSSSPRAAW